MKPKPIIPILALAAAVAIGGWYVWHKNGGADPAAAFALSGNVDVHQVELAFRVGGRISQLQANEGDRVRQGQVLAQLDPAPVQNDVAAATAAVAVAKAQLRKTVHGFRVEEVAQARAAVLQLQVALTNAQVTARRLHDLAKDKLVTQQQLDDADARDRKSVV
jgi:HlyD family secretion protein